MRRSRVLALPLLLLGLASCVQMVPPSAPQPAPPPPVQPQPLPSVPSTTPMLPPPAPPGDSAAAVGIRPGPPVSALAITPDAAARGIEAFRISCPSLLSRADRSGIARPADWRPACEAARNWPGSDAVRFFTTHFETAIVGGGRSFATGYFEPEIAGSRTRRPGYDVPVYRIPDDLRTTNPATGRTSRGRVDARGNYVLYHDRAAIEDGALAGRGLEIAWVADPIDFFFLQIQGSGRITLPDGGVMRIGYAQQNGREYLAIGRIMRDRGLFGDQPVTMQGIVAWLRANPEEGRAIMRQNRSYIFFNELTGPGPLGALGRPVTPLATVAADPMFVPLGAPVFLDSMNQPEANGLWIAQDTGGAIKGANRFDTFWGAGEDAKRISGVMQASGRAAVLVPRGRLAALGSGSGAAPAPR